MKAVWDGPGANAGTDLPAAYYAVDGVVPGGFWTSIAFWNDLGAVTLALLVCAIFVWALATERLVLGRQYRKVQERADKLEDANTTLMQGMIGQTDTGQVALSLLTQIRSDMATRPADEVK